MSGLFLMFVMSIALGGLVNGYVDVMNHADETY